MKRRSAAAAVCAAVLAVSASAEPPRSGRALLSPALQAMQEDDSQNPGLLWVADGEAAWSLAEPPSRACADCHPRGQWVGVAARYPAFDAPLQRPVNLQQRINLCRQRHQGRPPWPPEQRELLALEAFIARASRGLPVAPPQDPRLAPFRLRGAATYRQRFGQLDLSCAHCHDRHVGARLGGSPLPPATSGAYPVYRLEWQSLGGLQRRLRACLTGVRAEPWPYGAIELVELELYLAQRSAGLPMEAPGVRP